VLKAVLVGLAVGVALTSPFALTRLIPALVRARQKHGDKAVDKAIEKIFKDHFVQIIKKDGKNILKITKKGRRKLITFDIDTISIKSQEWDGMWRFVIFDIPEKQRAARDVLRDKLKEIGFIKIQKSVWVCPYECENEIDFIAGVYNVEPNVNYLVAQKVDHENYLKVKFGL